MSFFGVQLSFSWGICRTVRRKTKENFSGMLLFAAYQLNASGADARKQLHATFHKPVISSADATHVLFCL